ncbi:MAG: type II toxin-antitoxin system RelE/ParE family toxin [Roseobacter sp.]|uniref:type II toxin-antitoxin system RelE/ParE family toxin n=1 Tax=Roseibium sp. TaxID=1936156 RepID=UPI003264DC36
MGHYQLTSKADADIDGIYEYTIQKFGLRQAQKYLGEMEDKFSKLVEYPSFGSDYGFISPDLRRYELAAHSVYYVPAKDGILILRVLGNSQDPAWHF